jgi:hypothetical protein
MRRRIMVIGRDARPEVAESLAHARRAGRDASDAAAVEAMRCNPIVKLTNQTTLLRGPIRAHSESRTSSTI